MLITRVNGTVRPEMDAGLRRGIAAAAVLLIVCVLAVGVVSADTVPVSSFDDLMDAITNAPNDRTIIVNSNIAVSGSDAIPAITKNITLTTNNTDHNKIYRTGANTSSLTGMFIIQNGGNLTIKGNDTFNLTLDGAATPGNMQPLVRVEDGGNFTLAGGGILTNNTADYGGGVYVGSGGTFTMSGGILTNNTADYGGGVYVHYDTSDTGGGVCMFGGTFTMSGGKISSNTADDGGGVYMFGGTFTMSDNAAISGNTADYGGGGVYVSVGSTFEMSGGTISGNAASGSTAPSPSSSGCGGGVYLQGGTFTMSGGKISSNTADYGGGGVFMFPGTFKMSGGKISSNTADVGGGVGMFDGTFTMSDNAAIFGNRADEGGGVYVGSFGTFELSGSGSTDSVYLVSGKFITVTGTLNGLGSQISGIELEDPDDGRTVVTGSLQKDDLFRFELGQSVKGFELKCQNSNIVLKLSDPAPLPPSGGSSGDGNMENAFRVLFNDGATTLTVQTDLSYGDKLTKPEDPVKDGYTFAGWYKDSACTQGWDFETGIPGDMTLYAKWTAAGSSGETEATATPTATAVTTPQPTKTQTAAATTSAPEATTAAGVSPTLTQAPAPVAGALFGLLAAGVLLRRRLQ